MKLVYSSANVLLVNHVRNLLESAGIAVQMKNEFLYSAAGELPPTATWPELWVDEADLVSAQTLLAEALANKSGLPHWQCSNCGEWVEGQFDLCWRCGAARPLTNPQSHP